MTTKKDHNELRDGLLADRSEENRKEDLEYILFPDVDLDQIFTTILQDDIHEIATRADLNSPPPEDKTEGCLQSTVVALPLSRRMLKQIQNMEDRAICKEKSPEHCAKCRRDHKSPTCHGILEKGDLIRCVVGGMIRVGLQTIMERVQAATLDEMLERVVSVGGDGFGKKVDNYLRQDMTK